MTEEEELAILEDLIDQLLRGIQETLQAGEILSDEFQGILARELETTTARIDELRTAIGQIPENNIPLNAAMASSNVSAFGYDDRNGRLLVQFLGDYPDRQGPIYAYAGVPKVIFDLFRRGAIPARTDGRNRWGRWWRGKVPSMGASLYTLIREGNYPYERVS
jgi:KTSC domain